MKSLSRESYLIYLTRISPTYLTLELFLYLTSCEQLWVLPSLSFGEKNCIILCPKVHMIALYY